MYDRTAFDVDDQDLTWDEKANALVDYFGITYEDAEAMLFDMGHEA